MVVVDIPGQGDDVSDGGLALISCRRWILVALCAYPLHQQLHCTVDEQSVTNEINQATSGCYWLVT